MAIAVTGATGQLGRMVIDILTQKNLEHYVVALVRSPDKAEDLNVAVREADYNRPETLGPALKGVTTLVLISSNEDGRRVAQHQNVIDAAKAAKVERIVYTSLLHADRSPLSLAQEHLQTELALKASGIAFTILRNGWYTENYVASLGLALAKGAFIGSAGNGQISLASRRDYAMAAAIVIISGGHDGKTYELAGDTSWTLSGLAAELSLQAGKTVPYVNLSEGKYAAALVGIGLSAEKASAIASWDVCASQNALFDNGRQLSKLMGRPTTPLPAAIAEALMTN